MRPIPWNNVNDRQAFVALVSDPYYQFPDAQAFAKGSFDKVWPEALTFLTACVGISLTVYVIKSFSSR